MNLNHLNIRKATIEDLTAIIEMLHDDILGKTRELPDKIEEYKVLFDKVLRSNNQQYMVVEYNQQIVGCCELAILYTLTLKSAIRLEVENVRVHSKYRSQGIGKWMFKQINDFAKKNNCNLIQLTTNKMRHDAHRFYSSIGYQNTHEGFKFYL